MTSEVTASHVPIVSRPEIVAAFVEKAAAARLGGCEMSAERVALGSD